MSAVDSRSRWRPLAAASRVPWSVAIAAFVAIATISASALASDPAPHAYELRGTGTIALDAPAQQAGKLRLKATLSPAVTSVDQPVVQSDGRFAMSATLAASSLVCYNDTIFRDDFDGDGF